MIYPVSVTLRQTGFTKFESNRGITFTKSHERIATYSVVASSKFLAATRALTYITGIDRDADILVGGRGRKETFRLNRLTQDLEQLSEVPA